MLQEVITAEGVGEGRGYTAFQMFVCGKGHAFGDIYSTWLHCKGFLARGRFCSLPLLLALSTQCTQGLKGVSARGTHGHRMLWSGREDWVLAPAKPQGWWKYLSSLQPGALTGARRSLLGKGKNKAECSAETHALAGPLHSCILGHLSSPLRVSEGNNAHSVRLIWGLNEIMSVKAPAQVLSLPAESPNMQS